MSMHWQLYEGDILDVPADVLVCSANVYLTLSGGVGGAFMLRYGPAMQEALNQHLKDHGVRHVEPGDVVALPGCGSPYRAVLHAVAVDALYDTSLELVAEVIEKSLQCAAGYSATTVAMTALATGYGRKSMEFFGQAVSRVVGREFPPVNRTVVGIRKRSDIEELLSSIPQFDLV